MRKPKRSDKILQAKARRRHEKEVARKQIRTEHISAKNNRVEAVKFEFIKKMQAELLKRFEESGKSK